MDLPVSSCTFSKSHRPQSPSWAAHRRSKIYGARSWKCRGQRSWPRTLVPNLATVSRLCTKSFFVILMLRSLNLLVELHLSRVTLLKFSRATIFSASMIDTYQLFSRAVEKMEMGSWRKVSSLSESVHDDARLLLNFSIEGRSLKHGSRNSKTMKQ